LFAFGELDGETDFDLAGDLGVLALLILLFQKSCARREKNASGRNCGEWGGIDHQRKGPT
jgi:hypothetical protein